MTFECIVCETVLKQRLILESNQKDVEKWRELRDKRFHDWTCLNDLCYGERPNKLSSSLVRKLKISLVLSASVIGQISGFSHCVV